MLPSVVSVVHFTCDPMHTHKFPKNGERRGSSTIELYIVMQRKTERVRDPELILCWY